MQNPTAQNETDLAGEIARAVGHNPRRCLQCGKCSAGCPMAAETHLRPHDVLRLVGRGERERLLADEDLWLCLSCETCSARCPVGCDPAAVIDALRERALVAGHGGPRRLAAFHRAFLDQIEDHGRVGEFGLVVDYKLGSRDLFGDVLAAPGMLRRGKLPLVRHRVRDQESVRRIFAAARREP